MANKGKKTSKRSTARENSPVTDLKPDPQTKLKVRQLVKDERTWRIAGTFFLLLSFFLLVSCISYFFTWRQDFAQVSRGSQILWDLDSRVENVSGKLGALLAHNFIYRLFGAASLLICTFFFVLGINLLWRRRVFSIRRNLKYVTLGMVSISAILAFVFRHSEFSWGGGAGNLIADWLTASLGRLGAALVLGLVVVAYITWQFNSVFKKLQRPKKQTQADLSGEGPGISPDAEKATPVEVPAITADTKLAEAKLVIDSQVEKPQYEFVLTEKEPLNPQKETSKAVPDPGVIKSTEMQLAASSGAIPAQQKPAGNNLKLEINAAPIEGPEQENPILAAASDKYKPYEPTLDLKNYKYPTLDLLADYGDGKIVQDPQDLENNKNQIINTLRNYDIEIQKIRATIGPTVTLYEIIPAAGVRISRIKNLEDDIALSLAALGIRIIAPIPGRGTIGIEVPNAKKTIVGMKTLLMSEKFTNTNFSLPIALGKKIDNENFIVDLATMPHLLMAGATGQGKSVGINAILVSLLYKKHPSQLKFVLVDPKKVELSIYSHIADHFLARLPNEEDAIITDTKKVINTLNALCIEMDNRYNLLKEAGCRNIKEYNTKFVSRRLNPEKGHQFLPFIVLVIDEFADLIMTAGKEIEMPLARLAQLARAVGIHLIIATQRPSVNIITGIIKANFPVRVAFKVSSKIDSRTILDSGGAEQLIGKGDMLISLNGEIVRLQCAFVDTPEIDRIVEFIGFQEGYPKPFFLPEYVDEKERDTGDFDSDERDSLFEEAARLIVANQIGSTSLLQRRMKLGYNRAGRLMDQLEAAGIVGPNQGSKAREVLIKTEMELQQHLDMM
jgi:S-DNA-T family DNA segregation ATPase FtsK/SpoIIIE